MSPVGAERGQHRRLRLLPLSIRATTLKPPVRYAVALASAGVVILLRHGIDPLWGVRFTFTMLYPAIVVSAWLGGFGPGMVATLTCAVAATYYWVEPENSWAISNPSELLGLLLFVSIGTVISVLNEAWRRGTADVLASEERLRVTLTSIGDGVITTDALGRVTSLNLVAESLTGWTTADAVGRALTDVFVIVHEESRQPVENPVHRVLRDGVIAGLANHTVLVAKDGREIPIDDSAAPITAEDHHLVGVVLIFRDITERRRSERQQSELADREREAHESTVRIAEELRDLQTITDVTLSSLNVEDLVRAVLSRVRTALRSDTATILMLDPDGAHLTPIASEGLEAEVGGEIRIPVGHGVAGRIAAGDQPVIVDDLDQIEVISPILRSRVKSLVGVPLKSGSRLVGVLHAGAAMPRTFTPSDAHLLSLAADRIGTAIERAHLHEQEQEARRAAETASEQLRAALEAGRMGTWEFVLGTGHVKWSPGLEAIHGYSPGAFPGTLEAFRAEIHEDDRERVLGDIRTALDQRREHHVEYRIVRTDGTVRWVEGRGQLVCDDEGRPDRMVGVCLDVTERKRSDETISLAIEAAPAGMVMVDSNGTIVMVNALTERILGYGRHELVGRPVEMLVPSRFRGHHSRDRAAFSADPHQRPMGAGRELHATRKDGTEVPVEIGLSPIRTSTGTFVLAAVTDITDRKHAEELLRTRTAELEKVLDLIPAAVWIARDPDCHEVVGNKHAAALFDVPLDTNLSQTPTPGHDTPTIRHYRGGRELSPGELPMQRAAATGLSQPNEELEVQLPGGRRVTMLGGAVPLTDDTGAVRGVVSAFSDISERKALEEQRAELLTREQAARIDVELASRLKDEFLAVLSHELRTPLNAILGYANLLAMGALKPDRAAHALHAIQRNAQAQARLISSLLDLSRILAGKLELDVEELDVSRVIDAAVDVIRPDADAKSVRIDNEKPAATVTLRGDAGRLQQVFWNLLSNAVKFTAHGGRVAVAVDKQDDHVRVIVSDNGHGIRPELLPHVFDRFRQGERHDKGSTAGLGLGLAVVREMVEAHHGSVVAHSAGEGLGSTFTVTLPLVTVGSHETTPAQPIVPPTESLSIDVLVVDDEGDVRDLLAFTLVSRGARVQAVSSAREALERIANRRFDVLLADLRMPDGDGYELIRTLRAREDERGLARLAAIAVTAYAAQSDRERAIAAGYDAHVAKPVDTDELVRAIARVIKAARV
jgi:PAS domain S-box-containing protein